jgi:hypothetical protein
MLGCCCCRLLQLTWWACVFHLVHISCAGAVHMLLSALYIQTLHMAGIFL